MAFTTPANGGPYTFVIFSDVNGNVISSIPIAAPGGITAGSDAQTPANVPETHVGLYNGSSIDRWRTTNVGDGVNVGIPAVGLFLFNGASSDRQRTANVFKPFNAQAVTASALNTPTSIWTPAAGKRFRLMGYYFSSSAASSILFHDLAAQGGGGLIGLNSPLTGAAGIVQSPPIGNGYLSSAANNQLWIDGTVATTISGFVFGTEE